MTPDRLIQLDGVTSPSGRRHVQVRILLDGAEQEFQTHELFLIRGNGDWDYVASVDAVQAIRWLIGEND